MKRRKNVISSDSDDPEITCLDDDNFTDPLITCMEGNNSVEVPFNTDEMELDSLKTEKDIHLHAIFDKYMNIKHGVDTGMKKLKSIIEDMREFAANTPNLHRECKENINRALDQLIIVEKTINEERKATKEYQETWEDNAEGKDPTKKKETKEQGTQCKIIVPTIKPVAKIGNINNEKGDNTSKTRIKVNKNNENEETVREEEETTWATVAGRKTKKTPTQAEKQIKQQTRKPKNNAIEIRIEKEEDYLPTLKKVKADAKMAENGEEISRVRKTRNGNVLIEIKNGSKKTEIIKEVIKNALGEETKIKSHIPVVKLEIREIDGATDLEEIQEAITKKLDTDLEQIQAKAVAIYPTYGGMQRAIVIATEKEAKILLKEEKIVIGWLSCKIKEKMEIQTCYRCLQTGHMAADCKGEDRSKRCRKCGKEGHNAKECQNELCCMLCNDKRKTRTRHWIGSRTCQINQQNEDLAN